MIKISNPRCRKSLMHYAFLTATCGRYKKSACLVGIQHMRSGIRYTTWLTAQCKTPKSIIIYPLYGADYLEADDDFLEKISQYPKMIAAFDFEFDRNP